jgi:alpha-1,3-fucosyltransferase
MSADVVPVVYGGANYSLYAPPHSYINVDDFDTIEQLGEHLRCSTVRTRVRFLSRNSKITRFWCSRYLIANPGEYLKYFWWKDFYSVADLSLNKSKNSF